jgi:hypothetical protein
MSLKVLLDVAPPARHVFEATLGGDERKLDGTEISLDELARISI